MNSVEKLFINPTNKNLKLARTAKKKFKVLQAVYLLDKASVNELMLSLDLSFPTLNTLIIELLDQKLITQHERGESIGGRKPNLYQLRNELFRVLCIEVDRFNINISYIDNNGNLLARTVRYPLMLSRDVSNLPAFIDLIRRYAEEQQIDWNQVTGLSISMPGLINKDSGENYTFFHATNFNLQAHLAETFGKTTCITNNINIASLAEMHYGLLRNREEGLVVLIDWGVSLGIISNGKIFQGKHGFAGEMGHISFVEDGELCYCGKRGCLETVASGTALVKRAKNDIANGTPTMITSMFKDQDLQPIDILKAAVDGDQYAIELISGVSAHLGKAIAQFLQVLNPECIVLSGSFATAASLITNPIQQQIQTYTMGKISKDCELFVSELADKGSILGLCRFFIEKYFEDKLKMG
ncbi:ROK family protein [Sphingobacterium sp. DK4209]|uniref:ROK family protein n=1 Tax=Sphingobacterium zhuxiongii TaxID=2662364 RepID=A0A5Q0QFS4_9SPHI|nr:MULTISPECIES: ROK family protein [unclassified Sphingobacterium]MVZ65112.1 ROK family protein [Sphingobacterium sp. DK4209]QGA26060.1 ROK family protein [Sphingobacterium sp. dk4302]